MTPEKPTRESGLWTYRRVRHKAEVLPMVLLILAFASHVLL